MEGRLPASWLRGCAADLIRLGKANDGGYLVSAKDVLSSDVLLGLGINDDWSFERDFVGLNDVPLLAYDGSVSRKIFWSRAFTSIYNPFKFRYWYRAQGAFATFFRGRHQHIEKFVGAEDGPKTVSMARLLREAPPGRLFLKVDIEGSEYSILDDIVQHSLRTAGLVIEFHDCHQKWDRIGAFIDRYPLPLVHVHANNYAGVDEATGVPMVLELTFSSTSATRAAVGDQPHPLDMPNDPNAAEITISFG